tara:strand:- start:111 stop:491 length:381 start_codon:yes stop_codon:yes gene_type:complete
MVIYVQENFRKAFTNQISYPSVICAIHGNACHLSYRQIARQKNLRVAEEIPQGSWYGICVDREAFNALAIQYPNEGNLGTNAVPIRSSMTKYGDSATSKQLDLASKALGLFWKVSHCHDLELPERS